MIDRLRVACLTGLLCLNSGIGISQTSTTVDTIPFELTSHNNISIGAILGKEDTLDLMFHTAASSVSLTTEAMKKLKSIS